MELNNSNELISLRRSSTQREVLKYLVQEERNLTPDEIAEKLNLSVNAVNLALFHLHKKGLIKRVSRGIYSYKLGPLLLPLLEDYLKAGRKRR